MAETADAKTWVGFDLGGTKMMGVVFDGQLRPLARKRRKTKGHEGAKAGRERIITTIRDALDEAKLTGAPLSGIGIGVPGLVDLDKGIILDSANLGWKN